jgi:hypothetical protein
MQLRDAMLARLGDRPPGGELESGIATVFEALRAAESGDGSGDGSSPSDITADEEQIEALLGELDELWSRPDG